MDLQPYLEAIEDELRAAVTNADPALEKYYGMFRYHLGWTDANLQPTIADNGKRMRPLLCVLSCAAAGGRWEEALPAAAALELVHNFSLIHDDIEDDSETRRGRTTVWKIWGLAQGINAGDGMFVLARLALGTLHRAISVQKCVQIVHTFDQATLALTEGQFLDLSFENRLDVSVDEYLQMIRGKTAALVAASTAIGAQVASDNPQVTEAFARFGENLGLAFQMVDDILGVWGDPAVTGKSAASDILTKKKTLPIIRGLNTPGVSAELRALYAKDTLADTDLARVLTLLAYARAREFTRAKAEEFHRAALAALAETGLQNEAMQALRDLADAMVERKR